MGLLLPAGPTTGSYFGLGGGATAKNSKLCRHDKSDTDTLQECWPPYFTGKYKQFPSSHQLTQYTLDCTDLNFLMGSWVATCYLTICTHFTESAIGTLLGVFTCKRSTCNCSSSSTNWFTVPALFVVKTLYSLLSFWWNRFTSTYVSNLMVF